MTATTTNANASPTAVSMSAAASGTAATAHTTIAAHAAGKAGILTEETVTRVNCLAGGHFGCGN